MMKERKKTLTIWPVFSMKWYETIAAFLAVAGVLCGMVFAANSCLKPVYWYARAMEKEMAGDYIDAYEIYQRTDGYGDSGSRATDCRYRYAAALFEAGEYETARQVFLELGDYLDSRIYAGNCTYMITAAKISENSDTKEACKNASEILDTASMTQILEELKTLTVDETTLPMYREVLPEGRIAAGASHIAVLFSDGTVKAFGSNDFGQCDTGDWTEVVAVAAGARHTVGLRSDGTVLAAGDNSVNQCAVLGWSDVVSVCTSEDDTLAVTADGSVLHTGYGEYDCAAFDGTVQAAAGQYAAAAVSADGNVSVSGCQTDIPERSGAVSADLMRNVLYVVYEDGSMTGPGTENWEDVVRTSACSNRLLGLRADGSVYQYVSQEGKMLDLSTWEKVAEVIATAKYAAAVKQDGSILLSGDYPQGAEELLTLNLFA